MTTPKGLKTRERIIGIATEHFFQFGLYEVTYQGIAKEAGLTQPAIYKYFKNMDELFLACCQHWDEVARQAIYTPDFKEQDAYEQLHAYVERHFGYSEENRSHDALMFGLYYYAMRSKPMMAYYQEVRLKGVENVARILIQGNLEGRWSISDPHMTAETAHSLIAGEIFKFLIRPKEESQAGRTERVFSAFLKLVAEEKP